MGVKHTKALKTRWATIPQDIRAKSASHAAKARWKNATTADRIAQGKMLAVARQK